VKELTEGIAENDALRKKMHLAYRVQTVIKQLEDIISENPNESVKVVDEQSGINLLSHIEKINANHETLLQNASLLSVS
jgi:intracellular sulfur oxidation DsrE/DsrF family protein